MAPTQVVHVHQAPYDVYVGRPSCWGNPFVIGRDGTRAQVLARYAAWIPTQPQLLARLPELQGKRLACFCRPAAGFQGRVLCHAQILAGLADGVAPQDVP